ncbi:hypothetical protein GCK72_012085 [Caenorhabditis remanei]|uniref:EGF-like domain-containing protein n=1 Tax=Caenorhabditis remanei TaxID=31234 RepID=A0A6A5GM77_CAERE|nr:hypothetical protein GCK72_012085 [Caenorhabditis remanei]KAF1755635.1 hypothetical protein GCK72_012085 [Caenorhabditis remanei]
MLNNNFLSNNNTGVAVLNKIAAISDGHLFVVNDPSLSRTFQDDYVDIISQIVNFTSNGQFMFSRNLAATFLKYNNDLGTLLVPDSLTDTVKVHIMISLAYKDASSLAPVAFTIHFHNSFSSKSVACSENHHGSNFYSCTIELEPVERVNVSLIYEPTGQNTDVLVRMWTDTQIFAQTSFVSSQIHNYFNPDEYNGAQYIITDQCGPTSGEILITDCRGKVSKKYDAHQLIPRQYVVNDDWFFFAPFFCDNQPETITCVSGSENKYDMQFVSGYLSLSQPFICRPGVGTINPNCTNLDENGNYYCNRDSLPYKRGPLGQVTDCLGHGFLVQDHSSDPFYCVCDAGYLGVSCENGPSE